jgi:putative acetyltransferase
MIIEIKPIEPYQIPEAKRIILSVARDIYHWSASLEDILRQFDERGELRDVDEFQSNYLNRRGIFLVAMDQSQVIGTGAIRRQENDTAELKRLWLLEAYHGQRIGYRLLQALLDFARNAGYNHVRLLTDRRQERAMHFYQQAGFLTIDCPSTDVNDVCMELAIYGKAT